MPRIRTLKPEHKTHRKVGRLSDRAYRLWVGLITEADDAGRLVEDAGQFRALIFGFQDRTTIRQVQGALAELLDAGLVVRYQITPLTYLAFPSWRDHQVINRPRPSTLPASDASGAVVWSPNGQGLPSNADAPAIDVSGAFRDDSVNVHGMLTDHSRGKGSEGIGPDRKGSEGGELGGDDHADGPPVGFVIPETIRTALDRLPRFGGIRKLRDRAFWQAQLRARPTVDFAAELFKAAAWCEANPTRAPKRNVPGFLHRWFTRSAEDGRDADG